MARVFPPVAELDFLSTPLNVGERQILDALMGLDDGWNIYVQPRLGMDQPDFVVLHPDFGVTAIEVKDWSLGMYRQAPSGMIEVCCNDGWRPTSEAPRFQAHRYRNTLFERFFAEPGQTVRDFSIVRAIVVMVRYTTVEARALLARPQMEASSEKWIPAWGGEDVVRSPLEVVTGRCSPRTMAIPSGCIDRLRRHLAEPESSSDQRLPLSLSPAAVNIDKNPSSARIRRVKGSAGSGKSLGLTARAARLAAEGKDVLVLTFNSTLPHYLHDLAARRCRELDADIRQITFTHFHELCRRAIDDSKLAGFVPMSKSLPGIVGDYEDRVDRAIDVYAHGHGQQFDAVLVDEGQDFSLKWWNFLRLSVCRPDGEMLLVADPTQDVYGKHSWTDEAQMIGAGFSGPWTETRGSYRMPPDLIPVVADFAAKHVHGMNVEPTVPSDHPQKLGRYEPTVRKWVNAPTGEALGQRLGAEVVRLLNENPDLAPSDVVFLARSHQDGIHAVKVIADAGFEIQHLFALDEGDKRRRKDRFLAVAPGVKGCTVHSFKGWESRAVVLTVSRGDDSHRLAYVSMTRVKGDPHHRSAYVTVVNSDRQLDSFQHEFMAS